MTPTLIHPKTYIVLGTGIIGAALILYTSFLFLSVAHVSFRASAEALLEKEMAAAGKLDTEYLALSRSVSLLDAEKYNLRLTQETHFATRNTLASSLITQDTLR